MIPQTLPSLGVTCSLMDPPGKLAALHINVAAYEGAHTAQPSPAPSGHGSAPVSFMSCTTSNMGESSMPSTMGGTAAGDDYACTGVPATQGGEKAEFCHSFSKVLLSNAARSCSLPQLAARPSWQGPRAGSPVAAVGSTGVCACACLHPLPCPAGQAYALVAVLLQCSKQQSAAAKNWCMRGICCCALAAASCRG